MSNSVGVDLGSASVDCAVVAKKGKVVQLKDYFSFKKKLSEKIRRPTL